MVATGKCLCGFIGFRYHGEVGAAGYCHCADCRRCTGSAFNVSVRCHAALLRIEGGAPAGFTKVGASGHPLTRHFCPKCGAPLFTSSPRHPGIVYVKAGIFDDPGIIVPGYQAWVGSAVAWAVIDDDLPSFERSST